MHHVLINLTLFKAGWLACVLGAAASMPVTGLAAVAAATCIHLFLARDGRSESILLVVAAALGLSWESTLVAIGVVSYDVGVLLPGIAPYWIVAMWVLFATTLNTGMRWLKQSTLLAAAAGAIGGPMSFYAGHKAGAVSFSDTGTALLLIGAGWAVLLPLMVRIATWLEDMQPGFALLRMETQGEKS